MRVHYYSRNCRAQSVNVDATAYRMRIAAMDQRHNRLVIASTKTRLPEAGVRSIISSIDDVFSRGVLTARGRVRSPQRDVDNRIKQHDRAAREHRIA